VTDDLEEYATSVPAMARGVADGDHPRRALTRPAGPVDHPYAMPVITPARLSPSSSASDVAGSH
jgi:hypothetical protein